MVEPDPVNTDPVPEPSVFTRIIDGDLPGRFVWSDPDVVAFLTIAPIRPGHLLVVPRMQIDRWTAVPPDLWSRLSEVAHTLGTVMDGALDCARVGLIVAGLEVPHCHLHLVPIDTEADLNFARADSTVSGEQLDAVADTLRGALHAAGEPHVAG